MAVFFRFLALWALCHWLHYGKTEPLAFMNTLSCFPASEFFYFTRYLNGHPEGKCFDFIISGRRANILSVLKKQSTRSWFADVFIQINVGFVFSCLCRWCHLLFVILEKGDGIWGNSDKSSADITHLTHRPSPLFTSNYSLQIYMLVIHFGMQRNPCDSYDPTQSRSN